MNSKILLSRLFKFAGQTVNYLEMVGKVKDKTVLTSLAKILQGILLVFNVRTL